MIKHVKYHILIKIIEGYKMLRINKIQNNVILVNFDKY
jgi:hypothetical protein